MSGSVRWPIAVCGLVLALSGCGPKTQDVAASPPTASASAPAVVAPPVAPPEEEGDAALDCSKLKPEAGSGPDIKGIRIGMSAGYAESKMTCDGVAPESLLAKGNYSEQSYEYVPPLGGVTPLGRLESQSSDSQLVVLLHGGPGEERVIGVKVTITFAPGSEPLLSEMKKTLAERYGSLEDVYRQQRPNADYIVAKLDKFVGDASVVGPVGLCLDRSKGIEPSNRFFNSGPHCGRMITARADRKPSNPDLVSQLTISITDGLYADTLRSAYLAKVRAETDRLTSDETKAAAGRKATF